MLHSSIFISYIVPLGTQMEQHCPVGITEVSSSAHSGKLQNNPSRSQFKGGGDALAVAEKGKGKKILYSSVKYRLVQLTKQC